MAWETRNGKRCYYKKRRVDGRVKSIYVGGGRLGQLASAEVEKRKAKRKAMREQREALKAVERALDKQEADTKLLIDALLVTHGYHKHKGQWRKKRT